MPIAICRNDIPATERAAFVACKSHRARSRVLSVIGRDRQAYYVSLVSKHRDLDHKGIYPVTAAELEELKGDARLRRCFTIPRVSADELHRCWA